MTKVLQIVCMQGVVVSATTTSCRPAKMTLAQEQALLSIEKISYTVLIVVLVLETKAQ